MLLEKKKKNPEQLKLITESVQRWSGCLCVHSQGVVNPRDELNQEARCNRQPRANALVAPYLLPGVTTYTYPGNNQGHSEEACMDEKGKLQSQSVVTTNHFRELDEIHYIYVATQRIQLKLR